MDLAGIISNTEGGDLPHAAAGSLVKGSSSTPNKNQYISQNLKRAVDWKIFELTSSLIDQEVDGLDFEESMQWFQPKNAEEVIEERTNEGLCGYPLCSKLLPAFNVTTKQNMLSKAKYRIDYREKRIYEIEKSIYYCCVDCLEKCEIWIKQLDLTLPYGRPVVKQLNLENHKKVTIDDVLDLLDEHGGQPIPAPKVPAVKAASTKQANTAALPPQPPLPDDMRYGTDAPPLYSHPHIDDLGGVKNVDFLNGKPVINPSDDNPVPKNRGVKRVPAPPTSNQTSSNNSTEPSIADSSTAPTSTTTSTTPSLPKSYIPKKVTGFPSNKKPTTDTKKTEEEEKINNAPESTTNNVNANEAEEEEDEYLKQYQLDPNTSKTSPQPPAKKTDISVTIDELMKTMKELQVKHNLGPKKQSPVKAQVAETEISKKKNHLWEQEISASREEQEHSHDHDHHEDGEAPHLVPQALAHSPLKPSDESGKLSAHSPILSSDNGSGKSSGKRPSSGTERKKTVEWNLPDDTKQVPPASSNAPNLASLSKEDLMVSRSKSQGSPMPAKLVPKNNAGGKGGGSILGLIVKERSDVAPLSEKAILTKKEPEVLIGTRNIFASNPAEEAQFYSQHIEGHYYHQSSNN